MAVLCSTSVFSRSSLEGALRGIRAAGFNQIDLLMIDGWVQADVECNPLLGPQVYEMALRLMNGQSIEEEVLTNETVYYPDEAEELLPTRKY